eukprot:TRINITY_DN1596_c0_g1_i5.p1 TRINITY_DN1596_c0_g1~~TRINITY_DN1596_c0_g1_i5.p1  ORF type:complete len:207 (-),score=59.56 TRINITY_DN1596_c0_g1_i5:143-763(-)
MAPWRALAAAAVAATIAAAVAATPATTAAGAAPAAVAAPATTPAGVDAALPTAGRQCTQAGDFPTHDGCSATVPSVVVPLHRLAGRWVMWDLSYDAVTYVKGLFGLGPAAQITCPTMDNTLPPIKILAVKASAGGRVSAFTTYQCPAGHAPPRLPCAQKGPPEVMGMWSRTMRHPGMTAYQVAAKLGLGIELRNEFQLLECPTFRA